MAILKSARRRFHQLVNASGQCNIHPLDALQEKSSHTVPSSSMILLRARYLLRASIPEGDSSAANWAEEASDQRNEGDGRR